MKKVVYIISDINKALAFEWITDHIDKDRFQLSFILILQKPAELEVFLKVRGTPYNAFYYSSKKDLINVLWQVYRLLIKLKPNVVHCHLLYGSVIGLTAARLAGIRKRIYTRHHSDYHQRYFPRGIKWDRWCNKIATKIIAPSAAVKEVLIEMEAVAVNKIQIIHHGFDLSYFDQVEGFRIDQLKAKYNSTGHYPVVGVISRLTELKGIQYIIPAFIKLLKKYPDALLLLFNAKGDYAKELKEQLAELPEKNYQLISFENDLAAIYPLFEVFIQVSTDRTIEAFGQTYVEALASGTPSIFTLSGIANDFIKDKFNALVVPYKNTEAIYNALIEVLNNSQLRDNLILNGKESVQRQFDLKVMIQKLEELYAS